MTEQPVETEQQYLGNEAPAPLPAILESVPAPVIPLQHYSPGAHLRRPSWSPTDNVELSALARKASHAAKVLAIAKTEAVKAEEALQLALGVEQEATDKLHEAEVAVRDFIRKDAGL